MRERANQQVSFKGTVATLTGASRPPQGGIATGRSVERMKVRVEANRERYFGEAWSVAWYSGFLWYSTNRKPQLISVERSFVFACLSFKNFSIRVFS